MTRVIQFADCNLKRLETEFVGRAVARSVDEDLHSLGRYLEGSSIGVIGVGDIGNGVLAALRRRGATLICYDTSRARLMHAAAKGYKCTDLDSLLQESDVVIGTTGSTSVSFEKVSLCKNGVLLCSASSRDIEFPMQHIKKTHKKSSENQHTSTYIGESGKYISISNDGFPVNFRGMSLPPIYADLMFAQVALAMLKAYRSPTMDLMQQLSHEDQEMIANRWWAHHGPKSTEQGTWTHWI